MQSSSPQAAKWSNFLLLLVFLGTFGLATLDYLGRLPAVWSLGHMGTLLGASLCLLGILGTIISQHQMGADWRLGVDESEKTELVEQGLYGFSRNPIYAAIVVFGLGLGFLVLHPLMFLFLLLGYLAIDFHVRRVEEPHLKRLHGEAFERYMQRVNRYWPL